MFDLHRHDEFSFYDGSGKAGELAKIAKEKGHTALGLTNHGNTSGLIQHYDACKSVGIKPIMGCEGYFIPKYKPQHRGYHLILIAKSLEGFKNLNIIQSEGEKQKFYNAIWDFDLLEKYHEGLICSSACVASFSSQCILKDEYDKAEKYLRKMKSIFGDDFYIEIQPYKVSDQGMQEKVNVELIRLSKKLKIKCILTSDSHRGRKEDLEPYIKMHELKNAKSEYLEHIRETYAERYMPDKNEMQKRFVKMHSCDFGKDEAKNLAKWMERNLEEIEDKCDDNIIDELAAKPSLPKFDENKDSFQLLTQKVKAGLKKRGLYNKKYINRVKEELGVIKSNHFEDYFLIVQDYTLWAKDNGIGVGPGRGSGCNCLVNYALEITDVDPIYFDLDYKRFIREDKKTLPDIDIDFETSRRAEVQAYMVEKYKDHSCQIASYGTNKVDNLINDLVKTYENLKNNADEIKQIKKMINSHQNEEKQIDLDELRMDSYAIQLNKDYKYLIDAFCFMYNKVKYMGTHAAGVAISLDSIYHYTAVRYDKKNNKYFSSYNLVDLERCGIIKYDLLGLGTLSPIVEIRKNHGKKDFDYIKAINDEKVINAFAEGKCNGIFQYNEKAAQDLLKEIHTSNFNDVVAASAMNRPGPLANGVPSMYAEAKQTWETIADRPPYSKLIDYTYGCILYQEQVNSIAVEYGGLNWNQADKLRKMDDPASLKSRELLEKYHDEFADIFVKGMGRYGISESEARDLFEKFLLYTFNKGHAVGYALISVEEMYNKVYYPNEFWYTKLKQTNLEKNGSKYMAEACEDGAVIFLPHVNYSAKFSLRKVEGEDAIQMGLDSIKGVGEKAATFIENERKKNGIYKSYDDFYDRCKVKGSPVNIGVINILKTEGALEFNKKIYIKRTVKFNSSLYSRA
jgi:DNA polymerase-3 subunit alpha